MRMVASILFNSVSHNVEAFLIVSFSISHFFVIFYWFIRLKLVLKIWLLLREYTFCVHTCILPIFTRAIYFACYRPHCFLSYLITKMIWPLLEGHGMQSQKDTIDNNANFEQGHTGVDKKSVIWFEGATMQRFLRKKNTNVLQSLRIDIELHIGNIWIWIFYSSLMITRTT